MYRCTISKQSGMPGQDLDSGNTHDGGGGSRVCGFGGACLCWFRCSFRITHPSTDLQAWDQSAWL